MEGNDLQEPRKAIREILQEIDNSKSDNLDELGGQYKEQVEIIYRDANMVCLIPKSQMTSKIYGQGTEWCQTYKIGFDMWSKKGLLIRFLFKDGTKIRFTYFFEPNHSRVEHDFYWATEKKQHLFHGKGDPFDFSQFKDNEAEKRLGKNIVSKLDVIPEECKSKVREFIERNRKSFEYCYSDIPYENPKDIKQLEKEIMANKENALSELRSVVKRIIKESLSDYSDKKTD